MEHRRRKKQNSYKKDKTTYGPFNPRAMNRLQAKEKELRDRIMHTENKLRDLQRGKGGDDHGDRSEGLVFAKENVPVPL